MVDNIILFGSTGMLGNYCLNILQQSYNVIAITRKDYDIMDKIMTNYLTLLTPIIIQL